MLLVFFRKGVRGSTVGDDATTMIDLEASSNIKRVRLTFRSTTQGGAANPENLNADNRLETNNVRVYKFESRLSPVSDQVLPRFFLSTSYENILYSWKLHDYEFVATGIRAPYERRIVFRIIHEGLFFGLLTSALATGSGEGFIKNLYKPLVDHLQFETPYDNENETQPPVENNTPITVAGGFAIHGHNFIKIPEELDN